jgi:hypothetical protein
VEHVVLTLPRDREFGAVADLVLAGLGSRLDLTIETIDDLQVALESLFECDAGGEQLTVRLELVDGAVQASVGPFRRLAIEQQLADSSDADGIGLRRVLETTVDAVELAERDGACWVNVRKVVDR